MAPTALPLPPWRLHSGPRSSPIDPIIREWYRPRPERDDLTSSAWSSSARIAAFDEYLHATSMQAIKRPEVPADLVGTVSFLTSDDAAFMTGAPAGVLAFSFLSDIASPGPRKSAPRSSDALQPWAGP